VFMDDMIRTCPSCNLESGLRTNKPGHRRSAA
jgi:hypothetical protein